MLKELFESSFYVTFPARSDVIVNLSETQRTGLINLRDDKACISCRSQCHEDPNLRTQLLVDTSMNINVISVDAVVSYIEEDVGESCDYMLDDSHKSVLVEMTCSTSDYVESKRQKARRQLYNTLNLFFTNGSIRKHFEQSQSRYVVFSWRDTSFNREAKDTVADNMLGMTVMSDAAYSPDNHSKFDFDFRYKEIRYPYSLVWSSL